MSKHRPQTYPGLDNDQWGGFTHTGEIIRNARIFGFIPENETCQGWRMDQIEVLWDKVNDYWDQHGAQANKLPPEVFSKFEQVHAAAMEKAKSMGWTPEDWLTASDFDGWIKEEDLDELIPPEWLERSDRHR
ncbi:MAG: hypothetical protein K0U21_01765 [Proteobacteria bacterium]|nr:hypothetical protein [Pseudomonadota bacterium]